MYRQYQGLRRTVGKCWFEEGDNQIGLLYTSGHVEEDTGGNIVPACWLHSKWYNYQVHRDEEHPPLPDNPVQEWLPPNGKLQTWLYDYHVDPNKLAISVKEDNKEIYHRDPPPGPGFNDIPPIIPDKFRSARPMTGNNLLCDVNGDGKCDAADAAAVHAALGSCRGNPLFDPRFDVNGDGCITAEDERILFPIPGDLNGDQKVRLRRPEYCESIFWDKNRSAAL
jgi:hypothetical protein